MKNKISKKAIDNLLFEEVGYDLERLKFILRQVPIVYCEITNGKLTYPYYPACAVIAEYRYCLENNEEEKVSNSTPLQTWQKATNDLAQQFANKYFDGGEWHWVADQIGGIYCIADYFFNLDRIVEALELNATTDQLLEFYDYELECHELKKDKEINFKNFVKYGFIKK